MARGSKCHRRFSSRQQRASPYPMPSCGCRPSVEEEAKQKKECKGMEISEKREWEYAICSVCMEFPHNAVLLLCSSHDKGCRPYMCGTSYRYSNCLDQFKKAYTKVGSGQEEQGGFGSAQELVCPLCRGQVKGWTVVEAARKYLNAKKRSCMQDECSFVGAYKELREHVRAEHACARPHQVDPLLRQKWRTLEHERDREDVISTIRSSTPGAMILGDYVIERGDAFDSDDDNYVAGAERDWLDLLFFQAIGGGNSANVSFRRVDGRRNGPIIIDDDGTAGADAPVALSDHGDDNAYPPIIRQGRSQMRRRRLRHTSQPRSLADLT